MLEIFSVTFLVLIKAETEVVNTCREVLVAVTIGTEPVGDTVEVIVTVAGRFETTNGDIPTAVKSIQEVLEKKLESWKAVASSSVISWENAALEVLTAPAPVFWYSPKKAVSVFGVLFDQTDHPAGLILESRFVFT